MLEAFSANWVDGQDDIDPERLIFIDESGLSTKTAWLRGCAPKGERCRAAISPRSMENRYFFVARTLAGFVVPIASSLTPDTVWIVKRNLL